jgi:hypothetical protein
MEECLISVLIVTIRASLVARSVQKDVSRM